MNLKNISIGPACRKLNPDIFTEVAGRPGPLGEQVPNAPTAPAKRLRQNSKPLMNRLESEWFNLHRNDYPNHAPLRPHAKKYRIGNGCWYEPDFSAATWPHPEGFRETIFEIKGPKTWEDAIVKLKAVATIYPEICVRLWWKDDGWKEQIILP